MVSVFSPSHNPRWLDRCYRSLQAQTFTEWEWVVVCNHGASWDAPPDERIYYTEAPVDEEMGVGKAKKIAVARCHGEILVELDHDDELASGCLEAVAMAFRDHPEAALVYSDTAQIEDDGRRDDSRFDLAHGWVYYDAEVDGRKVQAFGAMEPSPHNLSYIWYSPNHVRAFPRWAYDRAGGYDPERKILDDQDLMCRLYQLGPFVHIPECLYLQRVHDGNTQRDPDTNAAIQNGTRQLYEQWIGPNALAWAKREGLLAIDLGAAHNRVEGFLGVDRYDAPGVSILAELPVLPLATASVGVIRAMDFLEHVGDEVALMNELWRVLAPGGLLLSMTPSTDGKGAWCDPTHISYWNQLSFRYYCDPAFGRFVPEINARFQVSWLGTGFPSDWHREQQLSYVTANLIAIKPGVTRQGGQLHWSGG
jgi:glycosyltransferase involved in cell wall biosynthesis